MSSTCEIIECEVADVGEGQILLADTSEPVLVQASGIPPGVEAKTKAGGVVWLVLNDRDELEIIAAWEPHEPPGQIRTNFQASPFQDISGGGMALGTSRCDCCRCFR